MEETYLFALWNEEKMKRLHTVCKPALNPSVPAPKSAPQRLGTLDELSRSKYFKCGNKGHIVSTYPNRRVTLAGQGSEDEESVNDGLCPYTQGVAPLSIQKHFSNARVILAVQDIEDEESVNDEVYAPYNLGVAPLSI